MISNLTFDLEEEILSRVSLPSLVAVRSTCKRWRALCKDPNFTKKLCGALMTYYMRNDTVIFSLVDIKDLPSIKEIAKIHCPVNPWRVYVCDGLLLLLLLSNPYLGQTRYIEAFQDLACSYVLGYDNNNNPKVLGIGYAKDEKVKIYDLKSNSWRVLDITPDSVSGCLYGVSLKGNTYFLERKRCVVCFDFTTERLRSPLHLPFNVATGDDVEISCIRGEHLALFFQRCWVTYEIEFWITTNIEHNAVSWTKLFQVDINPFEGSVFQPKFHTHRFYVDKEKKVALVCGRYSESHVIGEDGNYKEVDPRNAFYYTPSLVCLS